MKRKNLRQQSMLEETIEIGGVLFPVPLKSRGNGEWQTNAHTLSVFIWESIGDQTPTSMKRL